MLRQESHASHHEVAGDVFVGGCSSGQQFPVLLWSVSAAPPASLTTTLNTCHSPSARWKASQRLTMDQEALTERVKAHIGPGLGEHFAACGRIHGDAAQ
jgi:hypothetical protein